MPRTIVKWPAILGLVALSLCYGASGMAADAAQGDTSGPAAGKPTTPSAAVQKTGPNGDPSLAAGAPGVAAKPGSESGRQPVDSNGKRVSH